MNHFLRRKCRAFLIEILGLLKVLTKICSFFWTRHKSLEELDSGIAEKWCRGIFTIGADRSHRIEHTFIHHPDKYTCVCEMYEMYKMKKNKNENKRIRERAEYEKRIPAHLVPKSRFSLSMADNFIFFTQILLKNYF